MTPSSHQPTAPARQRASAGFTPGSRSVKIARKRWTVFGDKSHTLANEILMRSPLSVLAVALVGPWLTACRASDDGPSAVPSIIVSDMTIHNEIDCFKIETATATYVYGKRGAGFASIVDKDGRDWVSIARAARPGASIEACPSAASRPSSSIAATVMASTRRITPSPAGHGPRAPTTSGSSPRRVTAVRRARGTSTPITRR